MARFDERTNKRNEVKVRRWTPGLRVSNASFELRRHHTRTRKARALWVWRSLGPIELRFIYIYINIRYRACIMISAHAFCVTSQRCASSSYAASVPCTYASALGLWKRRDLAWWRILQSFLTNSKTCTSLKFRSLIYPFHREYFFAVSTL